MKDLVEKKNSEIVTSVDIPYSRCAQCPICSRCKYFKEKYKEVEAKIDRVIDEAKNQIKSKHYFNTDDEFINTLELEQKKHDLINVELDKLSNYCQYEKDSVHKQLLYLNKRYNFKENSHLIIIAEQIIKLKLKDFRLGNGFQEFGTISKVRRMSKSGEIITFPTLTPGLHYSIEIADKIANLMEKMDKIAFGETKIHIDATRMIPREEIFGREDGRVVENVVDIDAVDVE